MAFASVATLFINDTLNSPTLTGFRIRVQAIFDKDANMSALQALMRPSGDA